MITDIISYKKIVNEIAVIALPSALFFFCLIAQQSILLGFISKYYKDDKEKQQMVINAVGNSNLYLNCTLASVVIGLVAGFNVLGGNAIGQKRYYLFGIYFHRAYVVCYSVSFFIIVIHNFTIKYGLQFLGAVEKANEYAVRYSRISMYFVLFEILFNTSYRYLNMAKKSYITIIVLILSTSIHPLWCYLFIFKLNLGIEGAAISINISQFLTGISLVLYIIIKKPIPNTIFCFNKNSFSSIKAYFKIAIPSMLLLCCEWWAFELQQVVIIYSGKSNWKSELNIQIVCANIFSVLYSINIGYITSSSILCSKFIAQSKINSFRKTFRINSLLGLITIVIVSIIFYLLSNKIFPLFSDDKIVIDTGIDTLPFILFTIILQNIKCSLQGTLIGMRLQIFASIVCGIIYYSLTFGLSFLFVRYLSFGVKGIWLSWIITYSIVNVIYCLKIYLSDINIIIKNTLIKICKDQAALENVDKNKDNIYKIIDDNVLKESLE